MSATLVPFAPYAVSLSLGLTPSSLTLFSPSLASSFGFAASNTASAMQASQLAQQPAHGAVARPAERQWTPKASIVQQHRQRLHQGPALSIVTASPPGTPSLSRASSVSSAASSDVSSLDLGEAHTPAPATAPAAIVREPWHFDDTRGLNPHAHSRTHARTSHELPHIAISVPHQQQQQQQQHGRRSTAAPAPAPAPAPALQATDVKRRRNSTPSFQDFHMMFGRVE